MITLLPSPEQQQVVDSVADVLNTRCAVDRLRERTAVPGHTEQTLWPLFAELGWFGLALPEAVDGSNYTAVEEVLVCREFGRHLLSPSVLATMLGARIAHGAGQLELAHDLVSGKRMAALALPSHTPADARLSAGRIDGEFQVLDRMGSQLIVTWDANGAALLPIDNVDALRQIDAMDSSVMLERAALRGTAPLAMVNTGRSNLQARAQLLLASQLVGMAEAARDLAAEYASIREQFGKPIGSFQAVAHHCANMAVRAETAWIQTKFAALALNDERSDTAFQVSSAALLAMEAAFQNATMAIRVHGAMGFTADCPVHHYLKRSLILRRAAGGTHFHTNQLVAQPTPV